MSDEPPSVTEARPEAARGARRGHPQGDGQGARGPPQDGRRDDPGRRARLRPQDARGASSRPARSSRPRRRDPPARGSGRHAPDARAGLRRARRGDAPRRPRRDAARRPAATPRGSARPATRPPLGGAPTQFGGARRAIGADPAAADTGTLPRGGTPVPGTSDPGAPPPGYTRPRRRRARRPSSSSSSSQRSLRSSAASSPATPASRRSAAKAPEGRSAATSGAITLSYPQSWQRIDAGPGGPKGSPSLPGFNFTNPVAAGPAGAASQGRIVAGLVDASGASLLPAGFVKAIGADPDRTDTVKLGDYAAYRYKNLQPAGFAPALTLYAVPTDKGVATIACAGRRRRRDAVHAALRAGRVVAQADRRQAVRPRAGQGVHGRARTRRSSTLKTDQAAGTKALKAAKTPAQQAQGRQPAPERLQERRAHRLREADRVAADQGRQRCDRRRDERRGGGYGQVVQPAPRRPTGAPTWRAGAR